MVEGPTLKTLDVGHVTGSNPVTPILKVALSNQWMIYDSRNDRMKYVSAGNQRKAIEKAYKKFGVIPQRTDHARPRNCTGELMKVDEFDKWMSKVFKD